MEIEKLRIHSDDEEQEFDLSSKFTLDQKPTSTNVFNKIVIILPGNAGLFVQTIVDKHQLKNVNRLRLNGQKESELATLYEMNNNLVALMNYKQDKCIYKEILRLLSNTYKCKWVVFICNIHNVLLENMKFYQQSTKDSQLNGVTNILDDYSEEVVDDELIQFMEKQGMKGTMLIQHSVKQDGNVCEISAFHKVFSEHLKIEYIVDESSIDRMVEQRWRSRNYSQLYM